MYVDVMVCVCQTLIKKLLYFTLQSLRYCYVWLYGVIQIRSQLTKNDRTKFNTVLIIDVHARDIIDSFVRDRSRHLPQLLLDKTSGAARNFIPLGPGIKEF